MPTERSRLVKKLDKVFSKFIRTRFVDDAGFGECFTCGATKHWKEVDAGHFQSRGKYYTRWDEKNVQFQCKRCNGFRGGEQYEFAKQLDIKYGDGTAEDLVVASNLSAKFSVLELKELICIYNNKVEEIQRQKGI
tara:strand:+ start:9372 stop:9776 length:405 start_codon:yes stop_codon:yes gene_type:complete